MPLPRRRRHQHPNVQSCEGGTNGIVRPKDASRVPKLRGIRSGVRLSLVVLAPCPLSPACTFSPYPALHLGTRLSLLHVVARLCLTRLLPSIHFSGLPPRPLILSSRDATRPFALAFTRDLCACMQAKSVALALAQAQAQVHVAHQHPQSHLFPPQLQ
jgi:hypothetical protein